MDVVKFIELIDSSSIFFPSQKLLSEIDPFEGALAVGNIAYRELSFQSLPEEHQKLYESEDVWKQIQELERQSGVRYKQQRNAMYVSCWHMNEGESAALWSSYLSSAEGVAITTTYKKLKEAFSKLEENFFIGKVEYIDYKNSIIPSGNCFYLATHKRKSFEHERELRIVHHDIKDFLVNPMKDFPEAKKFKVNLEELIEEIYISPAAPLWIFDLIDSICKKYNFSFRLNRSDLSQGPLF